VVGRLAAEHLIDRGFERFAFIGIASHGYSVDRQRGFEQQLAEAGLSVEAILHEDRIDPVHGWARRPDQRDAFITAWLASLTPPTAVFCAGDGIAMGLTTLCFRQNVSVPEDVAVLGVDDDEMLADMAYVPFSSVKVAAQQIGYRAASIIDECLNGQRSLRPRIDELLPPIGVTQRQSTDIVAIQDTDISHALQFIRENACAGIRVSDILSRVPIARRTLEQRFRKLLGRSPQQEIRRIQLQRVKDMLAQTNEPLPLIAATCGFNDPNFLSRVFARGVGMTATAFRRQVAKR